MKEISKINFEKPALLFGDVLGGNRFLCAKKGKISFLE
jgi:hypothetical protein